MMYPISRNIYIPEDVEKLTHDTILTLVFSYCVESWILTTSDVNPFLAAEMRPERIIMERKEKERKRNEEFIRDVNVT